MLFLCSHTELIVHGSVTGELKCLTPIDPWPEHRNICDSCEYESRSARETGHTLHGYSKKCESLFGKIHQHEARSRPSWHLRKDTSWQPRVLRDCCMRPVAFRAADSWQSRLWRVGHHRKICHGGTNTVVCHCLLACGTIKMPLRFRVFRNRGNSDNNRRNNKGISGLPLVPDSVIWFVLFALCQARSLCTLPLS